MAPLYRGRACAGPLAAGDSFKLFDAMIYTGSFSTIMPTSPGSGLRYCLESTGRLSVVAAPQPVITSVALSPGPELVISGTNGPSGMTSHVVASTDVTERLTNWTVLAMNTSR